MINFNKIKQQHLKLEDMDGMPYCNKCTIIWPCEVITILDEFELFIKKMKFNAEVVDSWIKDYEVKEKFELGDVVSFINSDLPDEIGKGAIASMEPLPTYHLKDEDGRGWINVKQNDLTMIEKHQDKELVPHAHRFDCNNWRTCDCPPIVGLGQGESPCDGCGHSLSVHGKFGCNFNHHKFNKLNWLEVGCTCPIVIKN